MNLAPHHLQAILAALGAPPQGHEKRRTPRFALSGTVTFARLFDGRPHQWITAMSKDVSETGLGLVTSLALRIGERLVVRLPGGKDSMTLTCRVVHSRPVADGIYAVGLEFLDMAPGGSPGSGEKRPVTAAIR
jgi:hypothetical protein